MSRAVEAAPRTGRSLVLRNAQRDCLTNLRHLRAVLLHLLESELILNRYDLTIHLIDAKVMAKANLQHMQHEGPTDVITFDYADDGATLHGELLICPAVALVHAREFGTTWMSEVVRYAVHGVLHLRGYDDLKPTGRRRMKREEDRLMRTLERACDLRKIRKAGK
jgi:rRNA maturation RNase YbeY